MRFAFGVIAFTLGYAVFYYAMYMIWQYNPGDPEHTNSIPFSVLLGYGGDQVGTQYAQPPFGY